MSLAMFLQQCLIGTSLGGAYALIAIGYTLVYSILRLINFAHGDIFTMTGYFMIFVMAGLPWFIAIPVILIVITLLGVTIERVTYHLLRSTPRMSIMISAIGVSHLLQNLAIYFFTAPSKGHPEIPFLKKIYRISGLSASFITFPIPVLTLALVYPFTLLISHAKIGMAMRAVFKGYETVSFTGIKISKTITFIFAARSLLVGTGSILYFTDRMTVSPFSGALPGLKCFMVAAFGGTGSIPGAVTGGFILGFGETALVAMEQFTFSDAFTFILLIVMLLIRPTGSLGEKTTDKV